MITFDFYTLDERLPNDGDEIIFLRKQSSFDREYMVVSRGRIEFEDSGRALVSIEEEPGGVYIEDAIQAWNYPGSAQVGKNLTTMQQSFKAAGYKTYAVLLEMVGAANKLLLYSPGHSKEEAARCALETVSLSDIDDLKVVSVIEQEKGVI